MRQNTLTARDLEIASSATHYSIICGRERHEVEGKDEAFELAERIFNERNRGVLIYAVGIACGVQASALVATIRGGQLIELKEEA